MWKYYNHALLSDVAPHKEKDAEAALASPDWKKPRTWLIRYTDHYDDPSYTEWWYCIKDDPLDLSALKSKRRNEINKGIRNFEVRLIDAEDHREALYRIYDNVLLSYERFSGRRLTREQYYKSISTWKDRYTTYGAFLRESGELAGFAQVREFDDFIDFSGCKADPDYEKFGCNAALVCFLCEHYADRISSGQYILDGERNILHQTHFQDYLEKYFGFRKAYCKINVRYKAWFKLLVKIIYPFRNVFVKTALCRKPFFEKIGAILKLEEIVRKQNKSQKP